MNGIGAIGGISWTEYSTILSAMNPFPLPNRDIEDVRRYPLRNERPDFVEPVSPLEASSKRFDVSV
jgi:hypothetical protein